MIQVFVYGTLLVGEDNHHVVAPYLLSVKPGAVEGRLYDVGAYPALVLQSPEVQCPTPHIQGEWLEVTEQGLRAMDELEEYRGPGEENEYERVWIRDVHLEQEGWVYVKLKSHNLPEIHQGSWRLYKLSNNLRE